jgi:hypothetical protein
LKVIEMKEQGFEIAALVDELTPVQPLNPKRAAIAPALLVLASVAAIVYFTGARQDLLAGNPHPMFLLRAGTLLLLAMVSGSALLAMASPTVGRHGNGWKIAVAAALLFPLAALLVAMTGQRLETLSGLQCLAYSLVIGTATAVPMVLWLRRGAPVSLERAGWLTGISAGAFGTFAYGFHCPFNSIVYIGFWYSLAVALCAVAGRLVVPHLIRW